MQKLYTTVTLAEHLRISPRTVRRERKEGRLSFIRVRGQIRYREKSDVQAYLERNPHMGAQGPVASHVNWRER